MSTAALTLYRGTDPAVRRGDGLLARHLISRPGTDTGELFWAAAAPVVRRQSEPVDPALLPSGQALTASW